MLKGEVHFIYDTNLNTSFNENEKALLRTKDNKHELWTWTKQKEMKSFANKLKVDDSKFQEQTSPQDNQDLCKIHTWIMKTFANKFKTKDLS
jgi:hypothetical protein